MKTCIKCGANAYRDADPFCVHDYGGAPEPEVLAYDDVPVPWVDYDPTTQRVPERMWIAAGYIDDAFLRVAHPTQDGARAEWQTRWRWGRAVAALFGWLCERPEPSVEPGTAWVKLGSVAWEEDGRQFVGRVVCPPDATGMVTINVAPLVVSRDEFIEQLGRAVDRLAQERS